MSIFDYPDDVVLKARQEPQEDLSNQRKIIIKKNETVPNYLVHFFNKDTFDYDSMFVQVKIPDLQPLISKRPAREERSRGRSHLYANNKIAEQEQQESVKNQQLGENNESSEQEQESDSQEEDISKPILEGLIDPQPLSQKQQENQQQQAANRDSLGDKLGKDISLQKQNEESPKKQNKKQLQLQQLIKQQSHTQKLEQKSEQQQYSQQSDSLGYQTKQIKIAEPQSSRIQNFSLEYRNAQSNQYISMNQESKAQIEKQIQSNNIQDILQISISQLNKQVSGYDLKIPSSLQNQMEKQMKDQQYIKKIEELQNVPKKHLIYRIKTENCQRVRLKAIKDPLQGPVKLKRLQSCPYLQIINKNTPLIKSFEDQIDWKVGESKVLVEPIGLMLTCLSCKHESACVVTKDYFSVICNNSTCTKHVTVEIYDILFE